MKNPSLLLASLILISVVSTQSEARGGGMEGGGGIGVRCGNKLELLDLHEARLNGYTQLAQPKNDEEAIDLIADKMASHFYWHTWESLQQWKENFYEDAIVEPMYNGQPFHYGIHQDENGNYFGIIGTVSYVNSLPLANDVGTYKIAPGCKLEQIAYFTDANWKEGKQPKLEIVKSSWNQLDLLSRAVLIAHESLYIFDRRSNLRSFLRQWNPQTSEWTRGFVGALFSTKGLPGMMSGIPSNPKTRSYCTNYGSLTGGNGTYSRFDAVPTSNGFDIVFESLFDVTDLYQFKASFIGADFEQFRDTNFEGEGIVEGKIVYGGIANDTKLRIKLSKEKYEDPQLVLYEETPYGLKEIRSAEMACTTYENQR